MIHLIPTDKFKTTVAVLLLRQPLTRETATVTALIPNVLTRGCERYPSLTAMNRELEDMHGAVFEAQVVKKAEEQLIQLYMEFLPEDTSRALVFMREVLLRPLLEDGHFKASYVDGEKENLKASIESRLNNKAEYAKLRALEEMCRGERFGVYGDGYSEDIGLLTPESVTERYRACVKGTAELVILGDVGPTVEREATEVFSGLMLTHPNKLPFPSTDSPAREPQIIAERCDITQGKLCMGFRTGAGNTGADVYRLMLMSEVLGGGAGSKLFLNVREKENLCYYVSSFAYRAKATVFVQSGVDSRNFDRTETLVKQHVEEMAAGGVTDAELATAKKSLMQKLNGVRDSQAASIDFYMSRHMLNDPAGLEEALALVADTSRDEVCAMAARMRLDTVFRLTNIGAIEEGEA